jgi:hypothetical protein
MTAMQRSFLRLLFVGGLFVTLCGASMAEPVIRLVAADGVVYALLANHSGTPIKVRDDFLLDSSMGGLSFEIRKGEKAFPLAGHIDAELPSDNSYITLVPGSVTGHVFAPSFMAGMYGLKTGCYEVTAVYKDPDASDFTGMTDTLRSNIVRLCIDESTSSEQLSLGGALRLARNAVLSRFGAAVGELIASPSSGDPHFFRFTSNLPPANAVDVFVNRRTREVWVASMQQCSRYERPGVAASYDPYGQKPKDCGKVPVGAAN